MKHFVLAAAAAASLAALPAAHAADKPAAMVESVSAPIAGVGAMDYLQPGQTITLGTGTVLVLDYLASCVRETITGGTVQIGPEQSTVANGHVQRRQMECDGAELQLSAAQSDTGGVAMYRSVGGVGEKPSLTLRATMPLIVTRETAPVTIERIDVAEPPLTVTPAGVPGGHGRLTVDLALGGTALAPGGLYRISQGARAVLIRIDPQAEAGALPVIVRMLPL